MSMGLDHFNGSSGEVAEKVLDDQVGVIADAMDGASGDLSSSEREAIEHLVLRAKMRELHRLLNE